MIFHELYRNYFLHQAIHHPDLLHEDVQGKRVFRVIDIEEAFGDFRAEVSPQGFIMRLINYTYQIGLVQGQGFTTKRIQGGFLIAKSYSLRSGGETAYFDALTAAEKVTDEMIEKMIADSRAGHPLFNHTLDSRQDIMVVPVSHTGDGTYAGWRCIFSFENFWRDCIDSPEAPAWTDGGETPHQL